MLLVWNRPSTSVCGLLSITGAQFPVSGNAGRRWLRVRGPMHVRLRHSNTREIPSPPLAVIMQPAAGSGDEPGRHAPPLLREVGA